MPYLFHSSTRWMVHLVLIALVLVLPSSPPSLQTASPVFLVKEINPIAGSDPAGLTDINGTLYFIATENIGSTGLWRSDGTEAGTVKADFGANVVHPQIPILFGSRLLIFADGSSSETALFLNDGHSTSSTLLKDNFHFLGGLGTIGDEYFFTVVTTETQLWKTDGTPAGTVKVATVTSDTYGILPHLAHLGGYSYFAAGTKLWRTDGTTAGTEVVQEFPGALGTLTPLGTSLLFVADDGTHGFELWRTDGTPGNATLVKDIATGPESTFSASSGSFPILNNRIVFRVSSHTIGGLWSSDGTEAGTQQYFPITALVGRSSISNGHEVFFTYTQPDSGTELWSTDGTTSGTHLVADVLPGADSSLPRSFALIDGVLVFQAIGLQIWQSTGTAAGTVVISEQVSEKDYGPFVASGNYVFFRAAANSGGYELYAFPRSVLLPASSGNPGTPGNPGATLIPRQYLPFVVAP